MNNDSDWLDFDRQYIWHPYTSATQPTPVWPVKSAEGVRITLEDGRQLIDGMSSWWSVIHGYSHPLLNQAIHQQTEQFSHVMFGGLTHRPAVELCQRLVDITPANLKHVFLADSGSVSVEVALKMAIQYWAGRGQSQKTKMLALSSGYHGDTMGAMSVCDPVNGMHQLFNKVLPQHLFAPAPHLGDNPDNDDDITALATLLEDNHQDIAAVIAEPIVQGAGGMRIYRADYLRQMRQLCDQYNVLLILDEIATGFGRTGTLFACEHADVQPDILCVGKALTGGYMTLAATLVSTEVAEGICASEAGVLMHGPTFMGNALACAVANASLQLLQDNNWQQQVSAIETQLNLELAACRTLECVKDVRVKGAIGVVELNDPSWLEGIQERFVEHGVWIRPFRNLVYIMPPYVISQEELQQLTTAIYQVLEQQIHTRVS